MARSSLTITLDQRTPVTVKEGCNYGTAVTGVNTGTTKAGRQLMRKVIHQLEGALMGSINASHIIMRVDGAQPVAASGTAIMLGSNAADTVSLNGVAQTATALRASATLTCVSAVATDTVVIGGTTLTGVTGAAGANQFSVDTSDTACAASIVAAIAANATIASKVVAKSAAGVVTVAALLEGAAGNAITTITTAGGHITVGGNASSGKLAGGADPATDQFDYLGTTVTTARSLARSINASTTSLVSAHCEAANWAASITLATCTAGSSFQIAGHAFQAVAAAGNSPNVRDGDFTIVGTDTQDAAALVVAINTHPVLSHSLVAKNSSGVVTIRQRRGLVAFGRISPGPGNSGLTITTQFTEVATVLISSLDESQTGNAITLAESTSAARVTVSGARFLGGTGEQTGTTIRHVMGNRV